MNRFQVVLISESESEIAEWIPAELSKHNIDITSSIHCETPDEILQHAVDADILWFASNSLALTPETLTALHHCGAIVKSTSGADNVPVKAATERGIVVVISPEAMADSVSDHAIALMMSVIRQTVRHDRDIRKGLWDPTPFWSRSPISGKTLGLVGFGHIPRLVARKMAGFGMRILAYDPYVNSDTMKSLKVEPADLDPLLEQADIVSVHAPHTRETRGMINEARLRKMKKTAVLINTSRGAIIDEQALIRALKENWIAAAGLDVFTHEPLDADSPFLKMDNVVLTPHAASATEGVGEASNRLAVEAIISLSRGKWPRNIVNPDVRPRWTLE